MTGGAELGAGAAEAMMRAGAAYFDDRFADARTELEQAFRDFSQAGELRAAARAATMLGELHWDVLGNEPAGRGWLERARRLLERAGPCVEWGYWELARVACDRPDADELQQSADRALEIAIEYGDVALEARALADGGLALVTRGRLREGFVRLDEALAFLTAGEVDDPLVTGTALCAMLTSCDRAGDVERAIEWLRIVREVALDESGEQPRVLSTHCRLAFGGVLCAAGRFGEAEEHIMAALGPRASAALGHRIDATARLAELRLLQGRVDDAAALVAPYEDHIAVASPLAQVHLARGEPALATAVLQRAIRMRAGDVLCAGPLLALLVEAELANGRVDTARDAERLLQSMSSAVDTPFVDGLAAIASGRIAMATGAPSDAVAAFEAALVSFDAGQRPFLTARTHFELAEAHHAAGDDDAAIAEARAAHAAAQRRGVPALADRSAALLRSLGVAPPRPAPSRSLGDLTAREVDVLEGIQRGDSNAEIAAKLYLSPKTVEHHVSRILAKLGVRTRAEAAALAASAASAEGATE